MKKISIFLMFLILILLVGCNKSKIISVKNITFIDNKGKEIQTAELNSDIYAVIELESKEDVKINYITLNGVKYSVESYEYPSFKLKINIGKDIGLKLFTVEKIYYEIDDKDKEIIIYSNNSNKILVFDSELSIENIELDKELYEKDSYARLTIYLNNIDKFVIDAVTINDIKYTNFEEGSTSDKLVVKIYVGDDGGRRDLKITSFDLNIDGQNFVYNINYELNLFVEATTPIIKDISPFIDYNKIYDKNESLIFVIKLGKEDNVEINAVKINDQIYKDEEIVQINNEELRLIVNLRDKLGSNTLNIQKLYYNNGLGVIDVDETFYIQVDGVPDILSITPEKHYYGYGEDIKLTILANIASNYDIKQISINKTYHSDDGYMLVNTIYDEDDMIVKDNEITIITKADNNSGVYTFEVDSISYYINNSSFLHTVYFDYIKSFVYVGDTTNIHYVYNVNDLINIDSDGINILMNDIDLSGYDWIPIIIENGYFDGNGYKILNFSMKKTINTDTFDDDSRRKYVGLFRENNGIIKDVYLENYLFDFAYYIYKDMYIGALVAYNEGIVLNSLGNGNVNVLGNEFLNNYIGGLIGYNSGTIVDSFVNINLNSSEWEYNNGYFSHVGGLVGCNFDGTIINSYVEGNLSPNDYNGFSYVGVLTGSNYSNGTIINSSAKGIISIINNRSNVSAGVLAGFNDGLISNSYANGDVDVISIYDSSIVGGLVGINSGTIENVYAIGNINSIVKDDSIVGGLVGINRGTIEKAYAKGNVSSSSENGSASGGLVGINRGTIEKAYTKVDLSSSGYVTYSGGLVGKNLDTIKNVYAIGNVNSSSINDSFSGGLVGSNTSTIQNAYATGNVSSSSGNATYSGGLIGYNSYMIINTYATGNVDSYSFNDLFVGALVGKNNGYIINSYRYQNQVIYDNISDEDLPIVTDEELTDRDWYSNKLKLDNDIWELNLMDADIFPVRIKYLSFLSNLDY